MTIEKESGAEPNLSFQEHHDLGMEKLTRYNYYDAIMHFSESVKDDKYLDDWNGIAVGLLHLKMFDKLIKKFPEDNMDDINNPIIWESLGDAYHYKGNTEKAESCYRKVVSGFEKIFADDLDQLNSTAFYAKILMKIGLIEKAFDVIDKAIRKDPDSYNNWYVAGYIANKARVYEYALKMLDEAFKRNTEHSATWLELSIAHENLGDMEKAKICILEAFRRDPNWFVVKDRNFILNFEMY